MSPITAELEEPECGRLTEVINLGDDPDSEDTPEVERLTRRKTHRSKRVGKLALTAGPRKLQFDAQGLGIGTGEDVPGPEDGLTEEETRRLAAERKRKGKEAQILPKKPRKTPVTEPTEEPMQKAIRVPFTKGLEDPCTDSEAEEDKGSEQPEKSAYEKIEVWVTKKLLEAMAEFEDPRRLLAYKERGASRKLGKSGKRYDPESLCDIESEEEFLGYIGDIGFKWLLNHNDAEVPVALAKEFFATFRFKSTTDPDADSISFRLFNVEYVMSIREWSLRMGLFTIAEDEDGVWNDRMIGPPKNTPGFKPQSA